MILSIEMMVFRDNQNTIDALFSWNSMLTRTLNIFSMVLLSNSDYPKILSIIHHIMRSKTIFNGFINFIVNEFIL